MKKGVVYLIGAGPGDPELLTVKAARILRQADVILYDRLVSPELLAYKKGDALVVYCGKAPGNHTYKQEKINHMMLHYARQGMTVARLKGGDPFVFGRGAEEALFLHERNIQVELVPGVTASIGAAAYAGIPLTLRGLSSSFACVTASRCHGEQSDIRWQELVDSVDTLVIYMGIHCLPQIQHELLRHGKNKTTPFAIVEAATTSKQRTTIGTLEKMAALATAQKVRNPAIIIIGEVVRLQAQLEWLAEHAASNVTG